MQQHVTIVGGGTMGRGIALACALAGHEAVVVDLPAALDGIRAASESFLADRVKKGKLSPEGAGEASGRLRVEGDMSSSEGADWIIEAVPEDLELKRKLLKELDGRSKAEAMLCTNTSSLSVTAMASAVRDQRRVLGLHFFNPATVMPLVEVVRTCWTDEDTLERATRFVRSLGKTPVLVSDTPGFIVNRIARLFYLESMKIVHEGIATPDQVDRIMRQMGNFKMGPFELMDLVGIDVNFAVTRSVFSAYFEEPRFRPQRMQQELIDAERLGRKTGRGVYSYAKGEKR
jgi:3-hydroxybutyryl-CoA dehydrogenase